MSVKIKKGLYIALIVVLGLLVLGALAVDIILLRMALRA